MAHKADSGKLTADGFFIDPFLTLSLRLLYASTRTLN
jgi:hypothetical protein